MNDTAIRRVLQCNLHTHTNLCDGKHSAAEMATAAAAAGMRTLGFSGHSTVWFDPPCSMSREKLARYRSEITDLKAQYRDRMRILLGIEQDFFSDEAAQGFDFVIGSVHYLRFGEDYYPIDQSREDLLATVRDFCGGDIWRYLRFYYGHMATLYERTACDVVGHFDLVMKFNEDGRLFDPLDPRHLTPALEALDALLDREVVFEINTGAISRGYRSEPYPLPILLRHIAARHGRVCINSDAHAKEGLQSHFPEAVEHARAAGLGSLVVMGERGWEEVPL